MPWYRYPFRSLLCTRHCIILPEINIGHDREKRLLGMHTSPVHEEAGKKVGPLFDGLPMPQFYEVIAG
jgi:hypothetical protein